MKVPENAKKVFSGIIYDVYQWEQEMFDGSKQTFEMLKRPDTVEILCTKGDKILIAREEQPTKPTGYAPLGGRVDVPGESPLEAAKREILEEGGLESDDWELIKSWRPNHKFDWEIYLYVAKDCKEVAKQNLDAGEKIEVVELSFDEFVEIATGDNFWGRELTEDLLRMKLNGNLEDFKKKIFRNDKR